MMVLCVLFYRCWLRWQKAKADSSAALRNDKQTERQRQVLRYAKDDNF